MTITVEMLKTIPWYVYVLVAIALFLILYISYSAGVTTGVKAATKVG